MSRSAAKFIALCIGIALFTSAPIWGVQYFIHQDGSGHVQAAWTMLELLRGEPRAVELYQFNLLTFPNVTGHWIQAASLLFVSPFTSTKLMLSISYLGFVASVVWLRWCVSGREGLSISVLIAAAIGFNWLWLVGAYNFNIGLSLALIGSGCYYKWEQKLTATRIAILAILAIATFLSHIVAFLFVAAAIGVVCFVPRSGVSLGKIVRTAFIFLPAVPLVLLYASRTEAGGDFYPIWRSLSDPYSISQWVDQVRNVDSLYIMRRTTLPFIDTETPYFLVFAPFAWVAVSLGILTLPVLWRRDFGGSLPFVVLAFGFILVSFFSPDDLQYSTSTAGLMRQRLFLAGLAFLVPIFRVPNLSRKWMFGATLALAFVITFQTAAVWEYAIRTDRDAREFFAVTQAINERSSLGSIVIEQRRPRFVISHLNSINNYNAIRRHSTTWNNYEFAHLLFPLILREKKYQEFALDFGSKSTIDLGTGPLRDKQLETLAACLASTDPRIDTLIVWGTLPAVEEMISAEFGGDPKFESGPVRVFERR